MRDAAKKSRNTLHYVKQDVCGRETILPGIWQQGRDLDDKILNE